MGLTGSKELEEENEKKIDTIHEKVEDTKNNLTVDIINNAENIIVEQKEFMLNNLPLDISEEKITKCSHCTPCNSYNDHLNNDFQKKINKNKNHLNKFIIDNIYLAQLKTIDELTRENIMLHESILKYKKLYYDIYESYNHDNEHNEHNEHNEQKDYPECYQNGYQNEYQMEQKEQTDKIDQNEQNEQII